MAKKNTAQATIVTSDINLQSLAAKDVFPLYDIMREHYSVCQLQEDNMWALTRYEDVKFAMENPDLFSASGQKALLQPEWFPKELNRDLFLTTEDPPEHGEKRGLINRAYVGKKIQALLPLMQQSAQTHLDKIQSATQVDIMSVFVRPYMCELADEIIGADSESCLQDLGRWAQLNTSNLSENPSPAYVDTLQKVVRRQNDNFDRIIQRKRRMPQDDLISSLMQERHNGKSLTNCQLRNILELTVTASIFTPTHLLCFALIELAKRPDIWRTLKANPEKIPAFIEEVLRYSSVVRAILRRTTQPVEFPAGIIPEGALVLVGVAAANHDPAQFPNPSTFDMARPNIKQHLAFGHGAHVCIGAALARQQLKIALEAILARFDTITLPSDNQIKTPPSWLMNVVEELPVTFDQ